jgi:hypothetical protein
MLKTRIVKITEHRLDEGSVVEYHLYAAQVKKWYWLGWKNVMNFSGDAETTADTKAWLHPALKTPNNQSNCIR